MSRLVYTSSSIFPLHRLFRKKNRKFELSLDENRNKQILLSKIDGIDREYVERLEMAQIFDTEDFIEAGPRICDYLGMSDEEYEEIYQTIIDQRNKQSILPKLLLDLPKNYATISIASDYETNTLAVLWKGIQFIYSNAIQEGWIPIKFAFDDLYEKMNRPELIGSYRTYSDWPIWLDKMTDLTCYSNTLDLDDNLVDKIYNWGFPQLESPDTPQDKVALQTIQIKYLLQISENLEKRALAV